MTAVPVVAPPPTEQRQWLAPAPLWTDVGAGGAALVQPWVAELTTDAFVEDFLALVQAQDGRSPGDLVDLRPATTTDGTPTAPFRLFQPLSSRYYLLVATLVCRRPGIPDHAVDAGRGEAATFVVRRVDDDGESAFVPGSGDSGRWEPAAAGALVPGEEQLPMHPVPVAPFAEPGSTAAALGMAAGTTSTRTLLYGYVPVGTRERRTPAMADPAAALEALGEDQPSLRRNPAVDELMTRVVRPWVALRDAPAPSTPFWEAYPSLFLLLDLADWLHTHLDGVYRHVLDDTSPTDPAAKALVDRMALVQVVQDGAPVPLPEALRAVDDHIDLVRGADIAGPAERYDLVAATMPVNWLGSPVAPLSLAELSADALAEAGAGYAVPPELAGMIKDDAVPPGPPGGRGPYYVARAVFEAPPCRPVLSAPTHPFELARALDADAPARRTRIQVPDIGNLRSFNRGVAIEVPPSVERLVSRVTPDILKGDPLGPDGGISLGFICSFSLQIIFIVAFMLLLIFVLLLNIVFWWLPFFRICFPVPLPPRSQNAPSPGGPL